MMTAPASSTDPDRSFLAHPDDDTAPTLAVTALLVVQHGSTPWLDRTLDALVAQRHTPDRLVLVDASPQQLARAMLEGRADLHRAFPDVSVVIVPGGTPFAAVVDTAVAALPGPGEDVVVARRPRARARKQTVRPRDRREWLWLLHEDSAPGPDALEALLQVVGRSDRIGVAGSKVLELAEPRRLVNVGLDLTRSGRHVGSTMQGEPDQGQHDDRRDVLAVSSAGMLIRRDVYLTLGGFDPAFDGDGDGLDLCWRTHLLGHQVVVVPAARVHQDVGGAVLRSAAVGSGRDAGTGHAGATDAEADAAPTGHSLHRRGDPDQPAPRSSRTLRRHRQVALARCSALGMPFRALWIVLSGTVLALLLLLVKRPHRAVAELAQASAPLGVARVLAARSRFARRGRTRRRHLDSLFVPAGAALRHALDSVRDAVSTDTAAPVTDEAARLETGPAQELDGVTPVRSTWLHRAVRGPGLWMTLALTVAAGFCWRHLLTSDALRGTAQGLSGGQLRPFDTDASGIWRLWRDQWSGAGLGAWTQDHPYLPVLAALARGVELIPWTDQATSGATAVAWLLVLAMPLSGISAYLAGRALTRSAWPRAAAGLAWASLATLTGAVADGRLGPAAAHILLPLVLAGTFGIGRRAAGTPLTFATVLVAVLLGAFVPALLVATSLVALGVLVAGAGRARLRALVVLALPWLLLGPWTVHRLTQDWRVVLAGPGVLQSGRHPDAWQLALLHPGGPGSYLSLLSLPVVVLGLLGLLRRRPGYGRAATGLGLLALLGLAAALLAGHVTVAQGAAGPRTPWSGPALDLAAASLLGAALLGAGRWSDLASLARRWRAVLAGGLALALVWAGGLTAFIAWTQPVDALGAAAPRTPAVARQMATGDRAVRMLTVRVAQDGTVSYELDGAETGLPARDLDQPAFTDAQLVGAVGSLLNAGSGVSGDAHQRLAGLAVAYVGLSGAGDRAPLATLVQGVEGLSPMASNASLSLWRVDPLPAATGEGTVPPARLRLDVDGRPQAVVAATGPHARSATTLPPGPANRRLVVSEGLGWAARAHVTLNGKPLQRVSASSPTYAVGPAGGHLEVRPGLIYSKWRWAQGLGLLVVAFLAVPFGNARSRRRA